jgi:hypothetical protein
MFNNRRRYLITKRTEQQPLERPGWALSYGWLVLHVIINDGLKWSQHAV